MSDSSNVESFLTLAEQEVVQVLVKDTTSVLKNQCIAANSDWPMAEDIFVGIIVRCPEELFYGAVDIFDNQVQNHLWYAVTSVADSSIHNFATADPDLFYLFFQCLYEFVPEALTNAEAIRFSYA